MTKTEAVAAHRGLSRTLGRKVFDAHILQGASYGDLVAQVATMQAEVDAKQAAFKKAQAKLETKLAAERTRNEQRQFRR